MIYLTTNTAGQVVRFTLNEGRQYFTTAFTDYLLVLTREENTSENGYDLAQVLNVVSETDRVTTCTCTTIPLLSVGRYRYDVYGQNSNSNTDPTDASVVGLVERGYCILTDGTDYFDVTTTTFSDDIIFGQ